MIEIIPAISIATVLCLVLFIAVDMLWKLPSYGGVSGSDVIGKELEKSGGDLNGGWLLGHIITSPDASTGTILVACGYFVWGVWGAVITIVLVYIGSHICADKGYAGLTGGICATLLIWICTSFAGFPPESFIVGCVIAIFLVQGISPKHTSRILGKIWRKVS